MYEVCTFSICKAFASSDGERLAALRAFCRVLLMKAGELSPVRRRV